MALGNSGELNANRLPQNGTVRLGIVGCGAISADFHLPAALRSPRVEVTALVDRDMDRLRALSRQYACSAKLATSLDAVLGDVDAVIVATPNNTHAPIARAALERRVAVLVEKPLATSYADCAELCALAERQGTLLAVGYNSRYAPVSGLMKRLLHERFFGRLEHVHFEYGTAGGWAPLSGYNLSREQSGGGVLVVTGTHAIDRMLYWFGEPARVFYADDNHGGVEANCKAWLEFDNELGRFTGSFFFSKTVDLRNGLSIESDAGRVELPHASHSDITWLPKRTPGVQQIIRPSQTGSVDTYQQQMDTFAAAILGGRVAIVDGAAGAQSVKFFEGCYRARMPLPEPWAWYVGAREAATR